MLGSQDGRTIPGREPGSGFSFPYSVQGIILTDSGFCYIDARDCAQGFRLAITSSLKGKHVFNIANADIAFTKTTAELAKLVFPNVPYTPETDNPREGLISIKAAREQLGFEPQYDWQTEVEKLKKAGKA